MKKVSMSLGLSVFSTCVKAAVFALVPLSAVGHAESQFSFQTSYQNSSSRGVKISYSGGTVSQYFYGEQRLRFFNDENFSNEYREPTYLRDREMSVAMSQGPAFIIENSRFYKLSNARNLAKDGGVSSHLLISRGGTLTVDFAESQFDSRSSDVLQVRQVELTTGNSFDCQSSGTGASDSPNCNRNSRYHPVSYIRVELASGEVIQLQGSFSERGIALKGYDFSGQEELLRLQIDALSKGFSNSADGFKRKCARDFYQGMLDNGVPSITVRGVGLQQDEIWARTLNGLANLKVIKSDYNRWAMPTNKRTSATSSASIRVDNQIIAEAHNLSLQPMVRKLFESFTFEPVVDYQTGSIQCKVSTPFASPGQIL